MTSLPTLFGAEPLGRGSGNVESLTGFFARLCIARYVQPTQVIREFFSDRCPSGLFPLERSQCTNFLTHGGGKLDLQADSALSFARALESLTQLSGLHRFTFCALAGSLARGRKPPLGLRHKQWCPSCFAVWQADGTPLYEPLLWRFALAERCPVHRVALLRRCPTCDRRQPVVSQVVPIGHCVRCGHLLHDGALVSAPDEAALDWADRWALWRSVALSGVLAWTSALDRGFVVRPEVMAGRFSRLLAQALERPPVSWIDSRRRLGDAFGIDAKDIYRLVSGERGPSLLSLIDSCMQLGVDPVRLVRGDVDAGDGGWPPEEGSCLLPCGDTWRLPMELRERRSASRHPDRARALDEFIADSEAVDLGRVRRNGGTHASLASAFPLRYARAAELRAERVARVRQRNLQRFNAVLDGEIASSTPRPISELAASLGLACQSLSYYSPERSAKLVARRESFYSTRQPGLRERLHARLVAALQVRGGPTVRGIARSLGVKDFVVLSLYPEESRLLLEQRTRERKDASARCVAAMREDLARPRPHGVYWVADRLGISPGKLQRSDPRLYRTLSGLRLMRAAAAKRVRESAAKARADALRAERAPLVRALERELRSDSPRSLRAVALECGVRPQVLAQSCPDLYRRLVELREQLRRVQLHALRSRLVRALERELRSDSPRSLRAVALECGVRPQVLASCCAELYGRLVELRKQLRGSH